jgi:hypothetical protein
MGKSLDEIYRQMQQQQAERRRSEMLAEQKRAQIAEQQRREWVERNRLYERSLNPSAASTAVGSGGGTIKVKVQNAFLAFNFQTGDLYSIGVDGNLEIVAQIFNGLTVLSDCSDDPDFVYYVTYDNELSKVIFGKFNKVNYQRIDIDDTNLNSEINLNPNSLYYEGVGNFIYSAESSSSSPDTQTFYSISIDGQSINGISAFDEGSVLMNIFEYNSQYYSVLFDGFISSLNLIDLNLGGYVAITELVDYFSMNVSTLPENISSNTKVFYVFDVKVKNNEIWTSVIFTDKDDGITLHACIGKINIEEQLIDYVIELPTPLSSDILFTNFVVL